MQKSAKYLAYILYSSIKNEFKEGVISDLDDLLHKLYDTKESWSLVHFETYDSIVLARNRVLKIKKLNFDTKVREFILSKI